MTQTILITGTSSGLGRAELCYRTFRGWTGTTADALRRHRDSALAGG